MLGENLKACRKARRLSQEAVARVLGVSRQAISKWECGLGYPDLDNLLLLAQLYEVTLDSLFLSLQKPAPRKTLRFKRYQLVRSL